MKICLVVANYYPKISNNLLQGATKLLIKNNIKHYKKIFVPGVFEIPTIISSCIDRHDAFIALGCVIKGKTPHFNLISTAVINAIMDLSVKYKNPIGNGIITCLNKKQAFLRSHPNKKNKGGEAAEAALSLLGILKNESKWSVAES